MKTFFIILGSIFLALIILAAVGIGISAKKGAALDRESKAYVDGAVPAIVSTWNEWELLDRASPEFKQATQSADVGRLFSPLHLLGKLREYKGSEGQALIYHDLAKGTTISASYVAKAEFDAGSVQIDIKLIKHGDQWQILGFQIQPTYRSQRSNQALQSTRQSIRGA